MKGNKTENIQPTEEMKQLLRAAGSSDPRVAERSMRALALALITPIQEAVMVGDIATGIFSPEPLEPDATPEYPVSLFRQSNETDFVAYTVPSHGAIPTRLVDSDMVTLQTYTIANGIDWLLRHARTARWDLVGLALEVFTNGFTIKLNSDGWRTLIAAGAGRGQIVVDSTAAPGQFTKRLVSLMKTQMRRLGGGNTASRFRKRLTDLYMSPEALEDIREWGNDPVTEERIDPFTMREIFVADGEDVVLPSIYGVRLHTLDELGEGQEFQSFYETIAAMGTSDQEIVVGLDRQRSESFVMPIREKLSVFDDPNLHRQQKAGVYGWQEQGFGVLDDRNVLIGSF